MVTLLNLFDNSIALKYVFLINKKSYFVSKTKTLRFFLELFSKGLLVIHIIVGKDIVF